MMWGPNFVLSILFILVGIPVICNTIVKIARPPGDKRSKKGKSSGSSVNEQDREVLEEIFYGLKDLNKRIENLETILYEKEE